MPNFRELFLETVWKIAEGLSSGLFDGKKRRSGLIQPLSRVFGTRILELIPIFQTVSPRTSEYKPPRPAPRLPA
jgi:hypothetical protein